MLILVKISLKFPDDNIWLAAKNLKDQIILEVFPSKNIENKILKKFKKKKNNLESTKIV